MTDGSPPPGGMLLVTIDRLPAWILPVYGCTWLAMPALTELAGRGLALDALLAEGDEPVTTLAELAGHGRGQDGAWPLVTAAAAAGWSPAVVTDDEAFGACLPGNVAARRVAITPASHPAADESVTNLGRLFAVASDLLAERPCRFLWCHAASLGATWDAPPACRDAYLDPDDPPPPPGTAVPEMILDDRTDPDLVVGLRHVFAGQLTLLDACLSQLLDAVAEREGDRPWTILVAGVRGMPLGLHGRIGPGPLAPFGELVRLPAILVDHAGRMAAQRYGGLVTPADVAVTLVEQAGGVVSVDDEPAAGRSLSGLLDAWQHPARDRAICRTARGTAIATPAWHLVVPQPLDEQPPLLYAKPDDFFEACDVADRCPEVAAELAALARLAETDPAAAWTTPLSDAALEGV
jgi:hypothetical protein